jgi:hypothetical protein
MPKILNFTNVINLLTHDAERAPVEINVQIHFNQTLKKVKKKNLNLISHDRLLKLEGNFTFFKY